MYRNRKKLEPFHQIVNLLRTLFIFSLKKIPNSIFKKNGRFESIRFNIYIFNANSNMNFLITFWNKFINYVKYVNYFCSKRLKIIIEEKNCFTL